MPIPFSSGDLGRVFDSRVLTRGRSLGLANNVEVGLDGNTIVGVVHDRGSAYDVRSTPCLLGRRVVFDHHCSCGSTACPHLAAVTLSALDRFPILRKPEQQTFFDTLTAAAPEKERQRVVFELAPAEPPDACIVTTLLIGERSGVATSTAPDQIAADERLDPKLRSVARILGESNDSRTGVPPSRAVDLLEALLASGHARWHTGGKRLVQGEPRTFGSADIASMTLPPRSSIIVGDHGPWYVDTATGAVGPIRIHQPPEPAKIPSDSATPGQTSEGHPPRRAGTVLSSEPVIVERPVTPVIKLTRLPCPDELGHMQTLDALLLAFDYSGVEIPCDDDKQFVRVSTPDGLVFIRRDRAAETVALEVLRQEGLSQVRIAADSAAKGRLIHRFRGQDAAEAWQVFVAERVSDLQRLGWRSVVDPDFGPSLIDNVGPCDLRVEDASDGSFTLDFGIEIDGLRYPLLPILMRLRDSGGMAMAKIVGGELITSVDDGRVLRLPADRIARLLDVINDLIEKAGRKTGDRLELKADAAVDVLDLEEVLTTRWQDGSVISARVAQFRPVGELAHVSVPSGFTANLRPYQQEGVNWLQHLRRNELGGLLADDMGLGKTAQTIAHIAIEHDAGRLIHPVLVVVPTSLVPNWTAELARFAPHLCTVVLHGLDRHQRRGDLVGKHVVITTYTVLSRDIDEMVALSWHLVVLDEAQAIKSPSAKATQAVCRLETKHRLCLSGTPIENNLTELWSQFAFLMPGLLGQRKEFNRRFRTPIEKLGDPMRRGQLAARIRPFILRRSKSTVASELPPKHTILRRITLAPAQRELYEAVRVMMHEKVAAGIAARGLMQSQFLVLQALLRLRQICCDPRLIRLPPSDTVSPSSKLNDLVEIIPEMVAEGRRILLFSQFTSMLDLMKPALIEAGVPFVELRGDTTDRAEPVRRFEGGEVPLFLISLKAGGRGLNLTSADTVIHYDPWWNPAVEEQASDRAHRIGQTKSVFVYKLIAADTVEERIVALQERKASLARLALDADGLLLEAMDADDIDFLFGSAPDLLAA